MSSAVEQFEAGTAPGAGSFACTACNSALALESLDQLPACPRCGNPAFRRASIFEAGTAEHVSTTEFTPGPEPPDTSWLKEARERIEASGRYLVLNDGEIEVQRIGAGWTRIGRSVTADLRLDDPTVSRRHALLVCDEGEPLRILDDRSLNGIVLNGELVDWGSLSDGDELVIGRYHLYLLEA